MYILFFSWIIFFILIYYLGKKSKKEISIKLSNKKNRELMEKIYKSEFTSEEKKEIYEKFQNKCYKCGSKKNLSIDHHFPLSLGYELNKENAVILCKKCNNKKSNLMPNKFYSKEELIVLEKEYGINNKKHESNLKLKDLKTKNIKISFSYFGKDIFGISLGIVEDKEKIYNKKTRVYLKVEEQNEINLYLIENIKNLRREDDKDANI